MEDVLLVPNPTTMPDFTSSTAFFATARFNPYVLRCGILERDHHSPPGGHNSPIATGGVQEELRN